MALNTILMIGLLSQSIFVGGNIAISTIFIPIITAKDNLPSNQAIQFCKLYDLASRLMASSATISFACYLYHAFYESPDKSEFYASILTSIASIGVVPFTFLVIYPTVQKIKNLVREGDDDQTRKVSNLILSWNRLSIMRAVLFSVGFMSALLCIV